MEGWSGESQHTDVPLKLLLFTDKRPNSGEHIRQIRSCLKTFEDSQQFSLDVIDVGEQPYLAEHFKLVATPALVKISPQPQQTLMGSDIVSQLEYWWPKWQQDVDNAQALVDQGEETEPYASQYARTSSITHSAELMQLSDEIFRLKQIRDELTAQLAFKDHIIAMLAHDLRNPLTAASIAIETLEMGHEGRAGKSGQITPKLIGQLLNHAKTQIRAIDRMVTDILQAARGASTELKIQPKELDLQGLCAEVLETTTPKFQAKCQHLNIDIPQDLPKVYADAGHIRQVLVNLIDNAIKYTPEAGFIEVSALHRTTQKVQVTIHDTGPGIPKENREKIFEESFRLQRDQEKDGYGLGLSLCQRIVRAHYGQIWVDSIPGEGSYFHFTLPVYR